MKISFNWLKEYLDFSLTANEVAEALTNLGLEVEGVEDFESIPGGLAGLVVGEVIEVEKHPDADKLKLTKVNVGQSIPLEIVCGAPNVEASQKVIVAPINTVIYPMEGEPFKIKKAKIRGVESSGMICAEDEIGLGKGHDGIMILDSKAKVGTSAASFFDIQSDIVFDIGLTPNRSDAMSHIGVARDLAAFLAVSKSKHISLKMPEISKRVEGENKIGVKIEHADCIKYCGLVIEGITLAESPTFIKNRLKAIGIKPMNNVVDITNYVLWEMGQPLHAFDLDRLKGDVTIKKLKSGTKFITLDDEERKLDKGDLMICDSSGPLCIAGVFGGKESGVSDSTKNIFLESAIFDPISVRKSAVRHNLRTDAAQHFEKGIDVNQTENALLRAAYLISKYAGGKMSASVVEEGQKTAKSIEINLSWDYLWSTTGMEIDKKTVNFILESLGFQKQEDNSYGAIWKIPTYKLDVSRPADMVEEILRVYGFNNIKSTKPKPVYMNSFLEVSSNLSGRIRAMLTGKGYNEAVTLSLDSADNDPEGSPVILENGLSSELGALRGSMLPSLAEVIRVNVNRRNVDVKIFEIGKIYHKREDKFQERNVLVAGFTGNKEAESWQWKQHRTDFYDIKALSEEVASICGIAQDLEFSNAKHKWFDIYLECKVDGKRVGSAGKWNREFLKSHELKQDVWSLELDWDYFQKKSIRNKVGYVAIPKYPSSRRDLALIVNKDVRYADLKQISRKTDQKLLKEINLFDIYEDEKLGKGKKSYAMSFVFRHNDKTLMDKEVDKIMSKLIQNFETEFKAEIRTK